MTQSKDIIVNPKKVKFGDKVFPLHFRNSPVLKFSNLHEKYVGRVATFKYFVRIGSKPTRYAVVEFIDGVRITWRVSSLAQLKDDTSSIPNKGENPVNTIKPENGSDFDLEKGFSREKESSLLERAKAIKNSKQLPEKSKDKITSKSNESKNSFGKQLEIKFTVEGKDGKVHNIEKDNLLRLLDDPKELTKYIKDVLDIDDNFPDMDTEIPGTGFYIHPLEDPYELNYKVILKDIVLAPLQSAKTAKAFANLSKLILLRDLWNSKHHGSKTEKYAIIPGINDSGHPIWLVSIANSYPRVMSFYSRKMANDFLSKFREYLSISRELL